jgi:hypothetical protein
LRADQVKLARVAPHGWLKDGQVGVILVHGAVISAGGEFVQ